MPVKTVTVNGTVVDAAQLLAALHRNTQAMGLGVIHDRGDLSVAAAHQILMAEERFNFDYVFGRPIKVRADPDGAIDERSRELYDRDAGKGAFDRALAEALAV